MLDFVYDLTFYLYNHLSANLKLEMSENFSYT